MIDTITKKIQWNKNKIEKITAAASSPEGKQLLVGYGQKLYNEAKPKLPTSAGKRRHPTKTPLKNAIKVYSPILKKTNYKGEKFTGYQVQIKPKKRELYYFVVMAGNRKTPHGKIKFKYLNPLATSYPLEKAKRKLYPDLQKDFEKVVVKISEREGR